MRDIVLKPDILGSEVHNLAEPCAGFDKKIDDDAEFRPEAIEDAGSQGSRPYKVVAERSALCRGLTREIEAALGGETPAKPGKRRRP